MSATAVSSGSGLTFASLSKPRQGGYAQWVPVLQSQWKITAIKRLNQVLSLPQNWDSYGSCPPTNTAANKAKRILTDIDIEYFLAPRVVPLSGGGLQLEWEIGPRSLELHIYEDGSLEFSTIERGQDPKEGEIYVIDEVRQLFLWLLSPEEQVVA
jgi:hypothetical protein